MAKSLWYIALVSLLLIAVACNPDCQAPNITAPDGTCCLDKNADGNCDSNLTAKKAGSQVLDELNQKENQAVDQKTVTDVLIGIENSGSINYNGFSFDLVTYAKYAKKDAQCDKIILTRKVKLLTQQFQFDDNLAPKQTLEKTLTINTLKEIPDLLKPAECRNLKTCPCTEEISYELENLGKKN